MRCCSDNRESLSPDDVLGFANDGEAIIARDAKLLFSLPVSTIKIKRSRHNRRTRVNSSGDFATIQLALIAFRRQQNLRCCRIVATVFALICVEHVARATTASSDPSDSMNLDDARSMAATLMQQHNVPLDWSFGFDHAKVRFGKCDFRKRHLVMRYRSVALRATGFSFSWSFVFQRLHSAVILGILKPALDDWPMIAI